MFVFLFVFSLMNAFSLLIYGLTPKGYIPYITHIMKSVTSIPSKNVQRKSLKA